MRRYTTLITVDELLGELDEPRLCVVDCRFDLENPERGREDYRRAHVPGAAYAHLDDDLSAPVTADSGRHPLPEPARLAATLRGLGISTGSQVVAYDGGPGGIAARLWWLMNWLGHERVAVLDGGFAAWQAAGADVEAGRPAITPGNFHASPPRAGRVLTTAELAAGLADGTAPLLVDAREAARFRGEQEPIDTAAGHIPGALNFPYAQNLDDGRWRSPEALRAAWQACLGERSADWAVMCGSGVTACQLALSAAHAGVPAPRLYAGSWSEWIRDPARPVEP